MAWNKNPINPDNLTDAQGAKELEAHAIRSALAYDAYGTQTEFDVIVLTKPVPMATSDAARVFRGTPGFAADQTGAHFGSLEGSIAFRGRIVGNGFISPHASLPDPCNLDLATSAAAAIKVINLHTQFMSVPGYNGRIPQLGDTVKVKLQTGDIKFNLQYAVFSELAAPTGEQVTNYMASSCTTLVSKFSTFNADTDFGDLLLAYSNNSEEGGGPRGISFEDAQPYIEAIMAKVRANPSETLGYTALASGDCGFPADFFGSNPSASKKALIEKYPVTKCASRVIGVKTNGDPETVTGHPVWLDTLESVFQEAAKQSWWAKDTSDNGINPILSDPGYRSIEMQTYLRMKNCGHLTFEQVKSNSASATCKPPTAPIGKSRHNLGLAIDFGGLIGARDGGENQPSHKWLESKGLDGDGTFDIKNYQAENWHWSVDGA